MLIYEWLIISSVIFIFGDIFLINVLFVDDYELVCVGIWCILEDIKGIKVVGDVLCGEDVVKWCWINVVDVVLMDMSMLGIGGFEVMCKIVCFIVDVKIIMFIVYIENFLLVKVM